VKRFHARRRLCVAALASILPGWADAQAAQYRIGLLSVTPADQFFDGGRGKLLEALASLGFRTGENLVVEERYSRSAEELKRFAEELAALRPALIFTEGSIPTLALQKATRTVPIVTTVGDPVGAGFARTLQRPGGNITGLSQNRSGLAPKVLELLRLLRPNLRSVSSAYPADVPGAELLVRSFTDAARRASMEVVELTYRGDELDKLFDELARRHVEAVYMNDLRREAAAAAVRRRIALAVTGVPGVENGALLSVENDGSEDHLRMAAVMVKVLKGQRPADIPFDVANRFRSTMNAKTAAALGIRPPPEIALRIDRVIE